MDIRPGSMGKQAPGYEVRIVDDDGSEVETGRRGNIAIRSKVLDENGNLRKHPGECFIKSDLRHNDLGRHFYECLKRFYCVWYAYLILFHKVFFSLPISLFKKPGDTFASFYQAATHIFHI